MEQANTELQQAQLLHQNGLFKEAEALYKIILNQQNQEDLNIYFYLVDVLNKQRKDEESIELLTKLISQNPNNIQLKLSLGQTYLTSNNSSKARELMLLLLEESPQLGEAHYMLGNVYLQENNVKQAIISFDKTISINPKMVEAHYNLGIIAYQAGDKSKAVEYWEKAIAINPSFTHALLNLAHSALDDNFYEEAINYLNRVLSIDSLHYSAIKMKGMALHAIGETDEGLAHYLKIYDEKNPDEEVLTLIANANRDLNRLSEAEKYYHQVLKINPKNPIAKENLGKISGRKIEGWHFDMLGDLKRNEGYNETIKRVVKNGDTVLDIGTGSGLLSMMSARAGANQVYTCETIEIIADTAKNVIQDNGLADQISVYHAKSNKLKIGNEIPEKVDVVVSEILDCGLLGEGVLPSIRHAKANLLKENGKIIPASASVKGILIQSKHLKSTSPIKEISGFDLSSFGKFQTEQSYRREMLNNTPYTALSNVTDIIPIDFYDLPKVASPENPNAHLLEFEITTTGNLHAIAFWFDLHFDNQLSLSSGPEGEMIHWGQAVYCFPEIKEVTKGDIIKIQAEQSEMKIVFSLL